MSNATKSTLATKLVARPAEGGTVSVILDDLPAGTVTLHAVAYPNADGTGVAQAEGGESLTLVARKTTVAPLALDSRVATLTVPPVSVAVGATATVTVSAKDVDGQMVLLAVGEAAEPIAWATGAATAASVSGTGPTATVTGVAAGTTPLTATLKTKDDGTTVVGTGNIVVATATPVFRLVDLGTLGGTYTGGRDVREGALVAGYSVTANNAQVFAILYSDGALQNLGTLGGIQSEGQAVNARGEVVGYSKTASGDAHAFLFTGGAMRDLGTLDGKSNSQAVALNDAGQVTGWASANNATASHAFIYADGVMRDLGTLGGDRSIGNDINASGQVAGYSTTLPDQTGYVSEHAFLYTGGTMQDLGTLGGRNSGFIGTMRINDAGQVVGASDLADGSFHAFLYSGRAMQDLGTLGGTTSSASDLNAKGQVIGNSTLANGSSHGFLYSNGTMRDLGTLGGTTSETKGLDASGRVVGRSLTAGGESRGFLYADGTMLDVNDLLTASGTAVGWNLIEATGIASDGTILAYGYPPNTSDSRYLRAVLLLPVR